MGRGQPPRSAQRGRIRVRVLPPASVPSRPVSSSRVNSCGGWRRHYREGGVDRDNGSGRWDRSEPFGMMMGLPG